MQPISIFQVDAFTDKVFHGNPAAICILTEWFNDELLQAIAIENNLSETAFVLEDHEGHHIRWFTPNGEVSLCGHATLAAGFVLFELKRVTQKSIRFSSLSGPLTVYQKKEGYMLDFPALPHHAIHCSAQLQKLLNQTVQEAYESSLDYLFLLSSADEVARAVVNLPALAGLPKRGLILTAVAEGVDFYSRCFYPKHHVPEDPVTGSAHGVLATFWANKLNKNILIGRQGLVRQGEVTCHVMGERVHLFGECRWYLKGHLQL